METLRPSKGVYRVILCKYGPAGACFNPAVAFGLDFSSINSGRLDSVTCRF